MRKYLQSHRLWTMWVAALILVVARWFTDPTGGKETLLWIDWIATPIVVTGVVYLIRRALFPEARSHLAIKKALETPVGAGLVALGLMILTGLLFVAISAQIRS